MSQPRIGLGSHYGHPFTLSVTGRSHIGQRCRGQCLWPWWNYLQFQGYMISPFSAAWLKHNIRLLTGLGYHTVQARNLIKHQCEVDWASRILLSRSCCQRWIPLSLITATSSNVFRHSLVTQNFHMILSLPLNDITPTPCKHVTFIARCILETGGGLYRCVSGPTLRLNWYVILDGPGSTLCWCNCHPGGHILRQNTAYPVPWEDSISHVYDHR